MLVENTLVPGIGKSELSFRACGEESLFQSNRIVFFQRCAGVTFGAKVTKTWGLRIPHTPITLHKCGMLCLLQIGEILNLTHFVRSHEKFLPDFRKHIDTCNPRILGLPCLYACSPQTQRLLFGESISPNPFLFAKFQFISRIIIKKRCSILNLSTSLIYSFSSVTCCTTSTNSASTTGI